MKKITLLLILLVLIKLDDSWTKYLFAVAGYIIAISIISDKIDQYTAKKRSRKPSVKLLSLIINNIKIKGGKKMTTIMKPNQFLIGKVEWKDRHGKPTTVEAGTVNFSLSDASIGTITKDSENENQFRVQTGTDAPASTVLSKVIASADADRDPGPGEEKLISGEVLDIVFEAEEATGVSASLVQEPTDVPAVTEE